MRIQEESDPLVRENMSEYLAELLQDVCDYSWEAAKGAHSVLLHRMTDGVVNWSSLKEISKIRKKYAHTTSGHNGRKGLKKQKLSLVLTTIRAHVEKLVNTSGRTYHSSISASFAILMSTVLNTFPKRLPQGK